MLVVLSLFDNTFLLNMQWRIGLFLSTSLKTSHHVQETPKQVWKDISLIYGQLLSYRTTTSHDTLPDSQCEKMWNFDHVDKTTHVIVIAIVKIANNNHYIQHIVIIADA